MKHETTKTIGSQCVTAVPVSLDYTQLGILHEALCFKMKSMTCLPRRFDRFDDVLAIISEALDWSNDIAESKADCEEGYSE